MKIAGYDIDLEKAAIIINNKKFKKVILQIPDGLKIHFNKFVEFFEKNTKADVFISADPCFGACDLFSGDLKNLAVDFVIHIGHESIYNKTKISPLTFFINAKSDLDLLKVVEKAIPFLKEKKIGLVSTAQHAHKLDQVKKLLENKNFEVFIGKGDKRIKLPGQILGCNFSAATSVSKNVNIFLFIGSGNFHPLGLMLITKKKVIA
ncbi:MAG: diphthamide synthesis protein, partial [Thermoplasmatota archaeon]